MENALSKVRVYVGHNSIHTFKNSVHRTSILKKFKLILNNKKTKEALSLSATVLDKQRRDSGCVH